MKRPELKDYEPINGPGAYDYISDINKCINLLQSQLEKEREIISEIYQIESSEEIHNIISRHYNE